MSREQFAALMPVIFAELIQKIAEKDDITPEAAAKKLYNSKLYAMLEQEDTKLWQYSINLLYTLYQQEQETGSIDFPDV